MTGRRASRGIPAPTAWQSLLAIAAVASALLVWLEIRRASDSSVIRRGDAEYESPSAELEEFARSGPEGVPDLVAALANSSPRVRWSALLALRLMGPEAAAAVDPIRRRFTDDDAQVRSCAIDAYWNIRRDAGDVVSELVPMLGDPNEFVRRTATEILSSIGPPAIVTLVESLKTGEPAARIPSLQVLRQIGWNESQPSVDEALRELAHAAEPEVRIESLITLTAWGRPTSAEVSEVLQHKDTRETALSAVLRLGPESAENADGVIDILADIRKFEEWELALASLRAMQSAGRPAVPRLLQLAHQYHGYPQIDIAWVLLAIRVEPQEIVRLAVPLLLHKDTDICFQAGRLCATASPEDARWQVKHLIPQLVPERLADGMSPLDAIWGLAPEAREAVPALSQLLSRNEKHVARTAAKALGDIGPEAAPAIPDLLAQLARGLDAHDFWARSAFCEAIGKMGPAARSAMPALLAELNDAPLSRPRVHNTDRVGEHPIEEVLSALVRIGERDPAVLTAIRRHFEHDDGTVRVSAMGALAQLTPDSSEVLTCHLKVLHDYGLSDRVGVILAIGQLPGDRAGAVPSLMDLLSDNSPQIRKAAAWSLGKIGAPASAALPSLKEILQDWKGSFYSGRDHRRAQLVSPIESPRSKYEKQRWFGWRVNWIDPNNGVAIEKKSIHDVVREAIAEIEAGLE